MFSQSRAFCIYLFDIFHVVCLSGGWTVRGAPNPRAFTFSGLSMDGHCSSVLLAEITIQILYETESKV